MHVKICYNLSLNFDRLSLKRTSDTELHTVTIYYRATIELTMLTDLKPCVILIVIFVIKFTKNKKIKIINVLKFDNCKSFFKRNKIRKVCA